MGLDLKTELYLWLFVMALSFMGTLKSTLCMRKHIISMSYLLGHEDYNEEVNHPLYCNRDDCNTPFSFHQKPKVAYEGQPKGFLFTDENVTGTW